MTLICGAGGLVHRNECETASAKMGAAFRCFSPLLLVALLGSPPLSALGVIGSNHPVLKELAATAGIPQSRTADLETFNAELQVVVDAVQRGDGPAGLETLERLADKYPLPPAELILGRLFLVNDQPNEARPYLEAAVVKAPDYPGVYVTFGQLALAERRLTDAVCLFEKAQRIASSTSRSVSIQKRGEANSLSGLATVAELRGDWAAAREFLTNCLVITQSKHDIHRRLGRTLFELGLHDDALSHFTNADIHDETLSPPPLTMAWMFHQQGDAGNRKKWFLRALQEFPANVLVLKSAASWLQLDGQLEQAQRMASKAARLAPGDKSIGLLQGMIAYEARDLAAAEQRLNELHVRYPGDSAIANQLALVLVGQENSVKKQRGLAIANQIARLNPNSPDAISTLGWAHYRNDQLKEAASMLQMAMSGGVTNSDTVYYLARVMHSAGEIETAKKLCRAALQAEGAFVLRSEAETLALELGIDSTREPQD